MWSVDEADDGRPSHSLAQQGARFWTGTHAERRGMGATVYSRNESYGMRAIERTPDLDLP
jgi:hypothetical protein